MSTNSSIMVRKDDKTRIVVYCHWDGYLDYNGRILVEHYNTLEKALALVELGDISALGPRLAPNDGEEHSFNKPLDDVTIFYGRDRGEDWNVVKPIILTNIEPLRGTRVDIQEYNYIFKDGEWYYKFAYDTKKPVKGYTLVKDALKDLD